jgi:V/A-type H+/Na+-transporting ATPase subunit C
MNGFEYGNTRIRARRTRLVSDSGYRELMAAGDLDRLTGMLADGPYADDIEHVGPRVPGARRIDAAVARRLTREFREVRGFYPEEIRRRLSIVSMRWDTRNLISLVQAPFGSITGPAPVEEMATGVVEPPVLAELASQPGVRELLDLLVAWRLPSPIVAGSVRAALPEWDRTRDGEVIERALFRGYVEEVAEAEVGSPPDALSRQLDAEISAMDLENAVRLHEARRQGEPLPDLDQVWLRSGRAWVTALRAIVEGERPEVAELALAPRAFEPALSDWVGHGDAARFADDLDRILLRWAKSAVISDPLGLGVPVGYLWELEAEARNLRLVARAVANRLTADEAVDRLVVA